MEKSNNPCGSNMDGWIGVIIKHLKLKGNPKTHIQSITINKY